MKNIVTIILLIFSLHSCNQPDQQSGIKTNTDKEQTSPEPEKDNSSKEKDPALIGLWKWTEFLGSGEVTMTSETMMEFMEDGSFLTWPGRSVGPAGERAEDKSQAAKGNWYTSGNSLHFIDPASGQDAETHYTVSETGLLMSNGKEKKAFERIR